jgi:hypothetical protein
VAAIGVGLVLVGTSVVLGLTGSGDPAAFGAATSVAATSVAATSVAATSVAATSVVDAASGTTSETGDTGTGSRTSAAPEGVSGGTSAVPPTIAPLTMTPPTASPAATPATTTPTMPWAAAAPSGLEVAGLGVQAPVVPVLTGPGGVLHPPDDPAVLGWWLPSALPGAADGRTVIVGHVDSVRDGLGALGRLTEVTAGDRITVLTESGGRIDYRVVALQYLDKQRPLPEDLFAPGGPPELVLITCGGPFDARTGSYRENVVVTATTAGA